ncbi:Crp/Fnr family transcriptional regulator [Paucibacter sp. APW11]|uniref:Crp/Fnr family transcriptional regulator n=1 Tax=Roseateles aquae TaxID=3077235 RepID=A0ABU3PE20_9BURK|nr:Crp/Fnr family transcriptional regulator [Paucibacter sp. APW11]MDT9000151.1 Crp/Fnr family transcriptional regulator [Paucibacter sp. APW11]
MSFTNVNSSVTPVLEAADSAALRLLGALAGQDLTLGSAMPSVQRVRVAAGAELFGAEQLHPYVYVVRSGLLKLHYLRADGQEWIKSFSHEGMFFGSLAALSAGGRSSFSVSAIEASELERLDYRELEALAAREPAWLLALYRAMQRFAALKEQRELELLTLTPPERYAAFLAAEPGLAERIPLKDLARFLGITPVSLSRIRARRR